VSYYHESEGVIGTRQQADMYDGHGQIKKGL
jgi:hypothetical protein